MLNNKEYINKLRHSGLRPTRQRVKICEALFNTEKTFHFTIKDLAKIIAENLNEKISLATVYNTVHAFKKKGYLKEIYVSAEKSYYDTNITEHHHFFNEDTNQLLDAESHEISSIEINKDLSNKKVKSVEVLVRLASDNQNQK
tara:strand:+ start:35 stop:463 length:429 start_codon:yes stop_codon:yes gene_type:complete